MNCSIANDAACLNNEGISLINKGNYEDAMKSISRGLGMAKRAIVMNENEASADLDDMDMDEVEGPQGHFLTLCPECPSASLVGFTQAARQERAFVFSSPIYIPATSDETVVSNRYLVTLSFIMLYNLALTHHLSAIDGQLCMNKLKKALSLYELAYTIQMTENIELTVLQTMALVNNLGQIHVILGHTEKSKSCFEHLLSTIMFVNDCGERDSVESIDGFMCNVMSLIFKGFSSAPAA